MRPSHTLEARFEVRNLIETSKVATLLCIVIVSLIARGAIIY